MKNTIFNITFNSTILKNLKLEIAFMYNKGDRVMLYGVYIHQNDLEGYKYSTNEINILSQLTMETCDEIEVAIFKELTSHE